jgi:hypothetical protein
MNDFEHGGMLLMFFIFGAVGLLSEKTRLVIYNLTVCGLFFTLLKKY